VRFFVLSAGFSDLSARFFILSAGICVLSASFCDLSARIHILSARPTLRFYSKKFWPFFRGFWPLIMMFWLLFKWFWPFFMMFWPFFQYFWPIRHFMVKITSSRRSSTEFQPPEHVLPSLPSGQTRQFSHHCPLMPFYYIKSHWIFSENHQHSTGWRIVLSHL
jgi:hypothetical protein